MNRVNSGKLGQFSFKKSAQFTGFTQLKSHSILMSVDLWVTFVSAIVGDIFKCRNHFIVCQRDVKVYRGVPLCDIYKCRNMFA